ncbi:hypothetical protein GGI43DRAFT_404426 [Trichoderma evansii]
MYHQDTPLVIPLEIIEEDVDIVFGLSEAVLLVVCQIVIKMRFGNWDKRLASSALQNKPEILQSPIEMLKEKIRFLPSMYCSSQRVHML